MTPRNSRAVLSVGDEVIWCGAWGSAPPLRARVEGLELVATGEKYGAERTCMPWDHVAAHAVVSLDNGHWAYGHQISPVPEAK